MSPRSKPDWSPVRTQTAPSGRLRGMVVAVQTLSCDARDAMWVVFSTYYAAITREKFEADLAQKQDVIMLLDSADGSVQGFSTIEVYAPKVQGRAVIAVYSGDTVITEAYWGQHALHRAFNRYLLMTKLRHPLVPVYWFLISKGYKTYLLLARNVPNHYPRHDRATPQFDQAVLDALCSEKFGNAYLPEQGILRFETCQGRLKRGVAPIEASLLEHPDIRFFVEQNPGHMDGEELCCLGQVDAVLPVAFMFRQFKKAVRNALTRARRLWGDATISS